MKDLQKTITEFLEDYHHTTTIPYLLQEQDVRSLCEKIASESYLEGMHEGERRIYNLINTHLKNFEEYGADREYILKRLKGIIDQI